MNDTIILNVKTPVNLREVSVIERFLPKDLERLAEKTGMDRDRLAAFQSNIRFIDGTNILVTQSFEGIAAKAEGRLITVRAGRGRTARSLPGRAYRRYPAFGTGKDSVPGAGVNSGLRLD